MPLFLINLLFALGWVAMTADTSTTSLVFGFMVGFGILLLFRPVFADTSYFTRLKKTFFFIVYFLREVAVSSIRVAHDVITPRHISRPGVIGIPLDAKTDMEITFLANLITLTPGTLSLDVSEDRKTLYIHAMFLDDPDTLRREIKDNLERRMLELMR